MCSLITPVAVSMLGHQMHISDNEQQLIHLNNQS